METEVKASLWSRIKSATAKFLKRTLLVVVVVGIAVFAFLYWYVYDEGVKAGYVLSVSEKGMIFKTYEGKLNIASFGALKNVDPIAQTFDFSVKKSNSEVVRELEVVALSGERVNLHYVKYIVKFPWRGDTNVFIETVEREKK